MTWIDIEPSSDDGDDELAEILRADPRRIVAIVGELEAARALALRVAGRCSPAWSAGPGADVRALDAKLTGEMPVVVLDGADARRLLGELATRRLHPRLKVIVPCEPGDAPELPELAVVPRASILVAVVDADAMPPSPPRPPPELPEIADAPDDADDETRAGVAEARAAVARRLRDKPALADALREILARSTRPDRRARAAMAMASLTRAPELAEGAVAEARRAADPALVADALVVVGDLRGGAEARAAYDEAAAVHEADGAIGRAALVRSWSATIAADGGDLEAAVVVIARVIADRLALGDPQGAALALGRQARWEADRGRIDDAERCVERAAELATVIGDPRGLGYATWFLGALAERRGDGPAAIAHYRASLDAYAELGDVPDRVVASLASLQRAHDGTPPADPSPEPPLPPAALIPFGRRS